MKKINIRIVLVIMIFSLLGLIVYQDKVRMNPSDYIYEENGKCYRTEFDPGGKYPGSPRKVKVSCPEK